MIAERRYNVLKMSKRRKRKKILAALNLFKKECEATPVMECCEKCDYEDICDVLMRQKGETKIPQNWNFNDLKDFNK